MPETAHIDSGVPPFESDPALNTYFSNRQRADARRFERPDGGLLPVYDTPAPLSIRGPSASSGSSTQGAVAEVSYVGNHGAPGICRSRWILTRCPRRLLAKDSPPRPYPQFRPSPATTSTAFRTTTACKPRLRKRFSNGFSVDANYTWSKNLCDFDAAGWAGQAGTAHFQNAYAPASTYGL